MNQDKENTSPAKEYKEDDSKTEDNAMNPEKTKTPFRELSFTEKLSYLNSYYKWPAIAVILIVIFAVSLTVSIIKNNYDTVCYIAVIDGKMTGCDKDKDALSTGFTDYLGIDGKKTQIDIAYNFSLIEQELDQEAYISSEKLYTMASTGSIDGWMSEYDYLTYFSTDKEVFFYDLSYILTDEEMEYLKDYIIYYTKANGEQIPIAVDLSNAPLIKATDLNMTRPCYGIVVTSNYPENAANFIRYVFNMEKK